MVQMCVDACVCMYAVADPEICPMGGGGAMTHELMVQRGSSHKETEQIIE